MDKILRKIMVLANMQRNEHKGQNNKKPSCKFVSNPEDIEEFFKLFN